MHLRNERGFTLAQFLGWFVLLLLVFMAIMIYLDSQGWTQPAQNPECAHEETPLALPAEITNVVEYHDCQKMIEQDGKTYGTLAGIYARQGLGALVIPTVVDGAVPSGDSAAGGVTGPGGIPSIPFTPSPALETQLRDQMVAIGEIKSWDGDYKPLRFGKTYNCLYVVRLQRRGDTHYTYEALMLGGLPSDAVCSRRPPTTGGERLKVIPTAPQPGDPPFPAAARWDWDVEHRKQFIGILCAPDWCEVGDWDLQSANTNAKTVPMPTPMEEAVWEQKGRYDEQRLAIAGESVDQLLPSGALAIASPHPDLERYTEADFATWQPTAKTVLPEYLEVYKRKFNYQQGGIIGLNNQVFLCSGWRFKCMGFLTALKTLFTVRCWRSEDQKIWWSKIQDSNGEVAYRCVTRRTHGMLDVPATVRWRWKLNDEGLWMRCASGCCEIEES